jgi:acetoin utilization protein AcuB
MDLFAAKILVGSSYYINASDTVGRAIELINEHHIREIPICRSGLYLGILCEEDISGEEPQKKINELTLNSVSVVAREEDHIFDLMKKSVENKFRILPVLNEDRIYLGYIDPVDILKTFVLNSPIIQTGAIIVVEMKRRDYFLSELARIIESENANILGVFVSTHGADPERIEITLKVNRQDLFLIKATLERYGYELKASYSDVESTDIIRERYESLMSYLNV